MPEPTDKPDEPTTPPTRPAQLRFYTPQQGWVDIDPDVPLSQQPAASSWLGAQSSQGPTTYRTTFMETQTFPMTVMPNSSLLHSPHRENTSLEDSDVTLTRFHFAQTISDQSGSQNQTLMPLAAMSPYQGYISPTDSQLDACRLYFNPMNVDPNASPSSISGRPQSLSPCEGNAITPTSPLTSFRFDYEGPMLSVNGRFETSTPIDRRPNSSERPNSYTRFQTSAYMSSMSLPYVTASTGLDWSTQDMDPSSPRHGTSLPSLRDRSPTTPTRHNNTNHSNIADVMYSCDVNLANFQ